MGRLRARPSESKGQLPNPLGFYKRVRTVGWEQVAPIPARASWSVKREQEGAGLQVLP